MRIQLKLLARHLFRSSRSACAPVREVPISKQDSCCCLIDSIRRRACSNSARFAWKEKKKVGSRQSCVSTAVKRYRSTLGIYVNTCPNRVRRDFFSCIGVSFSRIFSIRASIIRARGRSRARFTRARFFLLFISFEVSSEFFTRARQLCRACDKLVNSFDTHLILGFFFFFCCRCAPCRIRRLLFLL